MGGWHVLRTRSNFEFKARSYLSRLAIDCFLPSMLCASRQARHPAPVERPAFPGYLFIAALDYEARRLTVLRTPGFVAVIKRDNRPALVEDAVIASLRIVLTESDSPVLYPYLREGQAVEVVRGALCGAQGFIVSIDRHKMLLVVSIHILGRSVAVKVNAGDVEVL